MSVAFSPNGKRIVSGGLKFGAGNDIDIWDSNTGELLNSLTWHGNPIRGVVFSPDGKKVVSYGLDKGFNVWDANSGELLETLHGQAIVFGVAFSPNGKTVASAGGGLKIWDASE